MQYSTTRRKWVVISLHGEIHKLTCDVLENTILNSLAKFSINLTRKHRAKRRAPNSPNLAYEFAWQVESDAKRSSCLGSTRYTHERQTKEFVDHCENQFQNKRYLAQRPGILCGIKSGMVTNCRSLCHASRFVSRYFGNVRTQHTGYSHHFYPHILETMMITFSLADLRCRMLTKYGSLFDASFFVSNNSYPVLPIGFWPSRD